MHTIRYTGKTPTQVDDFPAGAARSVKGALHLRPGTTINVTKDEFEHLQSKKVAIRLINKVDDKPPVKAEEVAPSNDVAASSSENASAPADTGVSETGNDDSAPALPAGDDVPAKEAKAKKPK